MLAVVCPGQGAQKPGFLNSWLEIPAFAKTLRELSTACDMDLETYGTTADEQTIKDTAIAQPLLVASAIASAHVLFEPDGAFAPDVLAGHSVGEIAAATLAGVLTPEQAMRFIQVRAEGMAKASAATPSSMAACVGGDHDEILSAIDSLGLTPANVNGGGQIVAAGSIGALDTLAHNPPERTRVIPLAVAGAFHTEFMSSAVAPLSTVAEEITPRDPQITLLSNAHGQSVSQGTDYLALLVQQVTQPVRWDKCQSTMVARGVTGLLELCPGGTLTGIAKRAMRGVEVFAVKTADDLTSAKEFITRHATTTSDTQ